jgi:hypothetical protein
MPEETKPSDFRYSTGEAKIPWAAVGENYNADDIIDIVKFLIQKSDDRYDAIFKVIESNIRDLVNHGKPPGKLSLGDNVLQLEEQINGFLGSKYATFLTNATAGFEIGYRYANLQKGDEVIAPAITFVATISYPLAVGAKVVFADLDQRTINMDPEDVERKITERTKVIIPVHIGGWPVDMDPIMKLAEKHGLVVVEDAAHAFGSVYRGSPGPRSLKADSKLALRRGFPEGEVWSLCCEQLVIHRDTGHRPHASACTHRSNQH